MGLTDTYKVDRIENFKGWILYKGYLPNSRDIVYSAFRGYKAITGAATIDLLKDAILAGRK